MTLSFSLSSLKNCSIEIIDAKELLDAQPTELWTGNGVHFVLPQSAIIMEEVVKLSLVISNRIDPVVLALMSKPLILVI